MFVELMRRRRSIRRYTQDAVTAEQQQLIGEALLRSPSGKSRRRWQFVFVGDRKTLQRLAKVRPHGSAMLAEATLAVAVLCDPEETDTWIEDCSIAAVSAQYAATDLGLGSCWVQIRGREHDAATSAADFVRSELKIPDQFEVLCLLSFGLPGEERTGASRDSLLWEALHRETFGQKMGD